MISRIPLKCLACEHEITARVQVSHEADQRVSSVCPQCYTPFRLRLLLTNPPHVSVEFVENCEPRPFEGPAGSIITVGSGFLIARGRRHEEQYFPSMDMPEPTQAEIEAFIPEGYDRERDGPLMLDRVQLLGGMPMALEAWRKLRNAYRFVRTNQLARAQAPLRELMEEEDEATVYSILDVLVFFAVRFLEPNGKTDLDQLLVEVGRLRETDGVEVMRLVADFQPKLWERLDHTIEVLDQFFRGYDEFNQAFMYVRRNIDLPEDPYAPSTDFDHTRMFYGEAFEVLGSHIDLLAAVNNILAGRPFDQLSAITLAQYRTSDKGRRRATLEGNAVLRTLVEEYSNDLRNATHHRWLTLSHDRSMLSYRKGGNGEQVNLSYAEYLWRSGRITRQLLLLMALEIMMLRDD